MFSKLSKRIFRNNIELYFSRAGYLYIRGPLGTISNKLFFGFHLSNSVVSRSLTGLAVKHLFALLNFGFFSTTVGYFVFIDLIGLGYRLKRVTSQVYRLYLGQSHFIYIYVPSDVLFWAFGNKITLFSIYADKLFSIFSTVMLLRRLNAYKLRGLMRPGQIVILKEGKQR